MDDATCLAECSVNLSDFFDRYDIAEESELSTLGGWVVEKLDKLPEVGDTFTYENLKVTVTEIDSHRVAFVEIVKAEPSEADEEDKKESEES